MPAAKVRRKAKGVPICDAWSAAIDVFSLVICVFSLFLTVSVLFVWQPVGLWLAFFILIGLIVHLARDVFDGRQQLIDVFAGFWRVLRSLWSRGVAGRATGIECGPALRLGPRLKKDDSTLGPPDKAPGFPPPFGLKVN